ncbi:hypothetical protein TWF694_008178 [Orbilia ellipsospora]|uniref:MARVEL domain-containing protein n=1 Tax=Orbilia ellipsospora TaxID=2528407 RepID=A0AAV9XFB1_9PEZI
MESRIGGISHDPGYGGIIVDSVGGVTDDERSAQATDSRKLQKWIFYLRASERVFNFVFSLIILGLIANVLVIYNSRALATSFDSTLHDASPLWPDYLMLIAAIFTMLFNLFIVLVYCFKQRPDSALTSRNFFMKLISPIIHVLVWAIVSGCFILTDGDRGLWYTFCTPSYTSGPCNINTTAWILALTMASFGIVGTITWVVIFSCIAKKKRKKAEPDRIIPGNQYYINPLPTTQGPPMLYMPAMTHGQPSPYAQPVLYPQQAVYFQQPQNFQQAQFTQPVSYVQQPMLYAPPGQ